MSSSHPPSSKDEGQAAEPGVSAPFTFALAALGLGLAFELLLYARPWGVSYPLWIGLGLAGLLALARLEEVRPEPGALGLALLAMLFAVMFVFRQEPVTSFLNVTLSLALLAMLVRSFREGRVLSFGWLDYGIALLWVPLEAWIRPWGVLSAAQRRALSEDRVQHKAAAVTRGLLLAFPVLLVFVVLLSSADLVFQDRVEGVLAWIDLDRLIDLIGRGMVIVFSAVFCLGAIITSLRSAQRRRLFGLEDPLIQPFLGFTESAVVVSLVDLLFAAFVAVQFRYLFGGESQIQAAGYTYSQYARRGFFELLVVALLSLGLIVGLAAWARRQSRRQVFTFKALSAILVVSTSVILVSAFRRLLLYEQAYGFTRLRTYTHASMIWLGLVLLGFAALLWLDRLNRLPALGAAAALGFVVTLNGLSVDAFIVHQNFAHLQTRGQLDAEYLASLSNDALPALVQWLEAAPPDEQEVLLAALACRQTWLEARSGSRNWPSYRWPEQRALAALEGVSARLEAYSTTTTTEAEGCRQGW